MWTYLGKVIRVGRGWTDAEGVKHPSTWNRWDDATKAAKGLVWVDDPAPYPRTLTTLMQWTKKAILYWTKTVIR